MENERIKIHRYPGVKPFSENERHVFYGRSTDTKKLYQLIRLEKLVLLYGKSGLGKSSLLNAGVLPLVEEDENYTTVKIRFGARSGNSLSPIVTSLFKLPEAISNPVLDKVGAGTNTLWLCMKCQQHYTGNAPKTYILVFDQFEELFTYSEEEIRQFKKQLAELLYAKVPGYISQSITNRLKEDPQFLSNQEIEYLYQQPNVKVVLSIRSDRLSILNTLTDYFPDILKNYYELKPLDRMLLLMLLQSLLVMKGIFTCHRVLNIVEKVLIRPLIT
jgi:energy-coupling factor transporter ATP-binding protein EcfA2